ncbi:prepilin-type N-terminal cleavage/methylation domain-containing protein [Opitutaceae bacterium TAV1]|nr:prepilin-type N-terminal cleavage/methylation domain-containing protein [Opitutaceae bacterium TAV1]
MNTTSRSHAFTLIELLTVIAIIGILAAILIPTIGSVRKSAKQAQCLSNVRQIGLAVILYAAENKGEGPTCKQDEWTVPYSKLATGNYVSNFDIYTCPEDTREQKIDFNRAYGAGSLSTIVKISYGISEVVLNTDAKSGMLSYVKLADMPSPSIVPLVADSVYWLINGFSDAVRTRVTNAGWTGDKWSQPTTLDPDLKRHKGGSSVCFMDGHARVVDQETTLNGHKNMRFNYSPGDPNEK